jgi:undecaprenyl diphosphate synthase
VRAVVEQGLRSGIEMLTLFAFSSENWRRPRAEVTMLLELFINTLQAEVSRLAEHNVRLRFIGDRTAFSDRLQRQMATAEDATSGSSALLLQVAANYGGRWDIAQSVRALSRDVAEGRLDPGAIREETIAARLCTAGHPDPDLFIRTGGEQRISNFLLWQCAYAELYFSDLMWPEFDADALVAALQDFARRQRRFGLTGEQVSESVVAHGG